MPCQRRFSENFQWRHVCGRCHIGISQQSAPIYRQPPASSVGCAAIRGRKCCEFVMENLKNSCFGMARKRLAHDTTGPFFSVVLLFWPAAKPAYTSASFCVVPPQQVRPWRSAVLQDLHCKLLRPHYCGWLRHSCVCWTWAGSSFLRLHAESPSALAWFRATSTVASRALRVPWHVYAP